MAFTDLSPLRALVRNLNFVFHGIDVTVDTIATRGIWLTPETSDEPGALGFHRRERNFILAIPLFNIEVGSIVLAPASPAWADLLVPPPSPGEILEWQVDGFAGLESDHTRVRLIRVTEQQPVPTYKNEIPAGAINGINRAYTLKYVYAPGEIVLVKNGLTLTPGVDYTETGPREFTMTVAPAIGDSLLVPLYRGIGA